MSPLRPDMVTLITGASSGIGEAAARLFARRGDTVILVARREDRLARLAAELEQQGHRALVRALDLAEAGATKELMDWVDADLGQLDNLINNAGFGLQCLYERMSWEDMDRMMRVNLLGLMDLSRLSIPLMRRGGGGAIVNVASVGGVMAHPLNVAYCATKHGVVGFSQALRLELWGTGIRVIAFCPAATATEFFDRARRDIPFDEMIASSMSPVDKVARALVRASQTNRAVVFPTWDGWAMAMVERLLPWLGRYGNIVYRDRVLPGAPE